MKLFTRTLMFTLLLLTGYVFASPKVNINTADASELEYALLGIGPTKAQAIVEYRASNGPFRSMDELVQVKGIGLKTLEQNRDLIVVDNEGNTDTPASGRSEPPRNALPRR
ncbi:MAG: helix-hairpin-helix domain-containing protein [Xanthomonadaceae bacterium]|nr:helix-hairpin-helix domain-containing protein [Xanthomonadaceae bacterium]